MTNTTQSLLSWVLTACGTLAGLAIAWAITTGWSTLATAAVVAAGSPVTIGAAFVVCVRISAALTPPGRTTSPRPRLAYRARRHRPALVLVDTPLPTCPACLGRGGWNSYYSDGSPEDGETLWEDCNCWNPDYTRHLVRLPQSLARWSRTRTGGYSDEPPF